jgi:NADPH-ferrihemoprotein reductase
MGSSISPAPLGPEQLRLLFEILKPGSWTDVAALGLFALAGVGYSLRGIAWDRPDPYRHIYYERPQQRKGAARTASPNTRNVAQKLEDSGKEGVIFWGSQSGTAEVFAQRLSRDLHLRFGLETLTADLSDYDPVTIALIPESKLAFFVLSTYGEGDPSDNAVDFWNWIRRDRDLSAPNIRFMAFGLGNSNYKYYNRVIDVTVKGLENAGAKSLLPVAKADDARGTTEEDFMSWEDDVFTVLRQNLHLEERSAVYQPALSVTVDDSLDIIDLHGGTPSHPRSRTKATSNVPITPLSIKASRELFTLGTRNCLHIELDLAEHPELRYKTGDHLAVWPINPDAEVERLLTALGRSRQQDTPTTIKSLDASTKVTIPTPTTLATIFRHCLEICAPVSRSTVLSLADFAPTDATRSYLLFLGRDRDTYSSFRDQHALNLGRLLTLSSPSTPWSSLPLSYILETLPPMQPRYYSISSSSVLSPRRPSITVLVSTTTLPPACDGAPEKIHGLATNYLLALSLSTLIPPQPHPDSLSYRSLLPEHKIHACIRRSRFKPPASSSTPIIMVANGTGLAPFRAFIAERAKISQSGKQVGKMILFFGCRGPKEDYIYREELSEAQGDLGQDTLQIVTAFSRVEGEEKMYVQDRMAEHGAQVIKMLEEGGASLYICGKAAMAREVGKKVGEALGRVKGMTEREVDEWCEGLKRKAKWKEDVW